jgi:catechol 2,3-dioxygenase-like lactoylglutathione lyase family enzyme
MISHIHSATIVVSDQEAALDFYTNTLGWEKTLDNPMGDRFRFVSVVPPGATTQLVLGQEGWFEGGEMPPKHTGISFVTRDIDATYENLSERGVRFKQPVETAPWGQKITWILDPDGNEFLLVEE